MTDVTLALGLKDETTAPARRVKRTYDDLKQGAMGAARSTDKLENSMASLGRRAGSLRNIMIGLGAVMWARQVIQATIRQEQAIRQVEQAIQSTGGAAGLTTQELRDMAAQFQALTTFGDEAVLEMQAILLTFTNLGRDVFPQASEAILDISVRMGQDLRSAAVQVGKALNDPIANLSALSRTGIQFTEAQKEMVKQLVETNRLAEAQKLILGELNVQFGGSARAARDTLGGSLQALQNAFGDLLEMDALPGLRSEIDKLTKSLQSEDMRKFADKTGVTLLTLFREMATLTRVMADNIDTIVTAFLALQGARIGSLFGPKGAVIGALLGLGAGVANSDIVRDLLPGGNGGLSVDLPAPSNRGSSANPYTIPNTTVNADRNRSIFTLANQFFDLLRRNLRDVLGMISTLQSGAARLGLDALAQGFNDLGRTLAAWGRGDVFSTVINAGLGLVDMLGLLGDTTDKVARQIEQRAAALDAASGISTTAIGRLIGSSPVLQAEQAALLQPFVTAFGTTPGSGLNQVRNFIGSFAGLTTGNITGNRGLSLPGNFTNALGLEGDALQQLLQLTQFNDQLKAIFGPDAPFTEIAAEALELSGALGDLTQSANELTAAQRRQTRLQFDLEEIALRTRFRDAFRGAGNDRYSRALIFQRFSASAAALAAAEGAAGPAIVGGGGVGGLAPGGFSGAPGALDIAQPVAPEDLLQLPTATELTDYINGELAGAWIDLSFVPLRIVRRGIDMDELFSINGNINDWLQAKVNEMAADRTINTGAFAGAPDARAQLDHQQVITSGTLGAFDPLDYL